MVSQEQFTLGGSGTRVQQHYKTSRTCHTLSIHNIGTVVPIHYCSHPFPFFCRLTMQLAPFDQLACFAIQRIRESVVCGILHNAWYDQTTTGNELVCVNRSKVKDKK